MFKSFNGIYILFKNHIILNVCIILILLLCMCSIIII